jgi:alpha-tubulin suppressor-like RCC1 family protein
MISGYDNVKFVYVACGAHHVLAISGEKNFLKKHCPIVTYVSSFDNLDTGSMWSWGNGEAGQLGHGNHLTLTSS